MKRVKNKLHILIIGGTGFIGAQAISYYSNKGYTVRALIRKKSTEKLKSISSDIALAYGDITDKKSLLFATKNIDWIINFAALKSDEKNSFEVNVQGVSNLIEAIKKNNVKGIIQISTISAKIKKKGIYGKTKAQADALLMESTVPYVILRPSIVYGDLKNGIFGSLVKASNLPVIPLFGNGKCYFYPIHVDDLITATEIAFRNKKLLNSIYDVGGPDKITFTALIQLLAENRRNHPILLHIPPIFGIITATILAKIFNRPPITVSNILGSTQIVNIDVQTFFKDFHFKPRTIKQGIAELYVQSQKDFYEAKVFISYILPKQYRTQLAMDVYKRYNEVIHKNKLSLYIHIPGYFSQILGPLDAFSKLFFPDSLLQKKVTIAATLIETTPYSADWLLPKAHSVTSIFLTLIRLCISTAIKLSIGFFLFLVPGLYKKYVY